MFGSRDGFRKNADSRKSLFAKVSRPIWPIAFLLAFAFPILLPVPASGQSVMVAGPVTVSQARALSHDSWVALTGNIINALPGGKNYTFRDSAGETITVEIGLKIWRGLSVGPADTVEIGGEVKVSRGITSINVRVITGGRSGTWPGQAVSVNHPITISEARNLHNDSWIVVTGNLVNSLGDSKYTFRDSSGETVVVEIERKIWRGLSVGVSDTVQIGGELKTSRGQISIKARVIRMH